MIGPVYLAGAIDFLLPEAARGWRQRAAQILAAKGVQTVDPCRNTGDTIEEIIAKNTQDLDSSVAVLAEHAFSVPHYGTTLEIEWSVHVKPVIVWHGDLHLPIYLQRHPEVVFCRTLEEACDAILAVVTPAR